MDDRRAGGVPCPPVLALGFAAKIGIFPAMLDRITLSPDVCNGRPVVRGTRITVQTVLEFLAAGDSVDVLAEYPALTREDVQACLDYASRLMANHYSVQPVA